MAFSDVISSWYFDFIAWYSSSLDVFVIKTAVFKLSRSEETFLSSSDNLPFSSVDSRSLDIWSFSSAKYQWNNDSCTTVQKQPFYGHLLWLHKVGLWLPYNSLLHDHVHPFGSFYTSSVILYSLNRSTISQSPPVNTQTYVTMWYTYSTVQK